MSVTRGASRGLITAIIVLALAVAGGAVALVLAKDGGSTGGPSASGLSRASEGPVVTAAGGGEPSTDPGATNTDTATSTSATDETATSNGLLPDETKSTMAADIRDVLYRFHQDIASHDFHRAWVLTTERYRAKKQREPGGYPAWASNQRSLGNHIDPSGLRVAILKSDPTNGVATVRVTGMGYDGPGPCSRWEGITWAKYENGSWRYEPGYSISDQRRAEWHARFSELLGGKCGR